MIDIPTESVIFSGVEELAVILAGAAQLSKVNIGESIIMITKRVT
jgi:hypothetical protein